MSFLSQCYSSLPRVRRVFCHMAPRSSKSWLLAAHEPGGQAISKEHRFIAFSVHLPPNVGLAIMPLNSGDLRCPRLRACRDVIILRELCRHGHTIFTITIPLIDSFNHSFNYKSTVIYEKRNGTAVSHYYILAFNIFEFTVEGFL